MVRKKGQVFLVIGIIILLSFILLKVATIPIPKEEILLKESFLDLKAEYAKTIDLTLVRQPPKLAETLKLNLDNFAKFSSDAFKQKNFEQKLLYSFTYNGSEVAVGNFLGQDISDVKIRLNEENPEYIEELKNGQSALRNFTRAESFVINISYKIDNEQKSFTYRGTTEDTVISYFDIWLGYKKSFFKDIFVEKRKITTLIQKYGVMYGDINYTKITEITEPFVIIISHSAGDTLSGFITISGVASYGSTIETITDSTFSGESTGLKKGSLMLNNSLTGEFTSDPIKTDRYIMWATLDWFAELNNQTLEFWIKSSSDPQVPWSKANKGEKIYFGSGKELQYMVNFTTTGISVSPVLRQVTLRYAIPNSEKEPIVKVRVDGIEGIATKSSFDPKTGILNWNFYFNTNRLLNGAYQISAALYEEGFAIAVEDYYINIAIHNELWPAGKALPTCPFGCRIVESGVADDLYGLDIGSVLIGGANGRILSYDDKKIQILESRTNQTIRKVAFRPQGDYALTATTGSVISSNIALKGNFPVSTAGNDQKNPSVAFGDNKFFVVWEDYRYNNYGDIYAAIYDSGGNIIKPDFAVSTGFYSKNRGDDSPPKVAYGNGKFFVIWENSNMIGMKINYNVYAKIYDVNGNNVTNEFRIFPETEEWTNYRIGGTEPSIAFGDNKFFITWKISSYGISGTYYSDVYAKIYDSNGNSLTNQIEVLFNEQSVHTPRVAYGNNKFFVIWSDGMQGALEGKLFDTNGNNLTADFLVFVDYNYIVDRNYPSIAYGNNNFLIVWEDQRPIEKEGFMEEHNNVYAKLFNINGIALTEDFLVTPNSYPYGGRPAVAYGNNKFIITWQDGRNGNNDIYAKVYDSSGSLTKDDFAITTASSSQERPSVAFGNGEFFIPWQTDVMEGGYLKTDIYADILTGITLTEGTEICAYNAATSKTALANPLESVVELYGVAWHPDGAYALLVGKLLGELAAAKGNFPVSIKTYRQFDQQYPSVAYGDNKFFVAWHDNSYTYNISDIDDISICSRIGVGYCVINDIYAAIYDSDGNVIKPDFAISTKVGYQGQPATAYGNNKFFVAWKDYDDIYAEIRDTNGNLIKDDFAITTATGGQGWPSVAFGDGKFFVAWQDNRNGSDIYAAIYDSNGNAIKSDFAITTATGGQGNPSVAYGNGKFFITWGDTRSGSYSDTYAAIYDSDGNVIKPDFEIATAENNQANPSVAYGDNKFFITWQDFRNYNNDIYAEIRDSSGNLIKDDFEISTDPNIERYPSVAYGDNKFFITWVEYHGHLYAQIRDTNGDLIKDNFAILPQTDTWLTTGEAYFNYYGGTTHSPLVAYGNGKFFVAWIEASGRSNSQMKIFADIFTSEKLTPLEGKIIKYDGTTYTEIGTGVNETLYNIAWHPLSSYALAVGEKGIAVRYNIDGTIEPLYFGTTADLKGVAWHPSGKYLLVVGAGMVIKYDGSDITTYSPTSTCYRWSTTCPPCRSFKPIPCRGLPISICRRLPGLIREPILGEELVIIRDEPLISSKLKLIKSSIGIITEGIKEEPLIEIEEPITGGLCVPCFVPYPCSLDAYGVAWHPSGEYAFIAGSNGKIFLFNHSTEEFTEIPSGTSANLFDVKWKNDGCYALAVGSGGTVIRYSCLLGISNVNVTNIKDDYAEISFETNDPATSQVTIWTTDPLVNTTFASTTPAYAHTIALTGLTYSTTYNYEIYANNTCMDEATSTGTFTTASNKYCESDGDCIKDDACSPLEATGVGCVNYKYPPSVPCCEARSCPPCAEFPEQCFIVCTGRPPSCKTKCTGGCRTPCTVCHCAWCGGLLLARELVEEGVTAECKCIGNECTKVTS